MAAPLASRPDAPGLFLALAPMDGVTDWVYRDVLTELDGGRGISTCVSEFVRVTRGTVPAHVIRRHCPEVDNGGHTRAGVPVFVQILGGDAPSMASTAALAASLGAPGIDINFGCPAKTVNNHDGGAAILKDPCRVEAITAAVRQAVPREVPVTVKIRLGWSDASGVVDIARAAEAGGADWLTIHARTKAQGYRPPVDWAAIGRAREAVGMPVVANGDIDSPEALRACAAITGCTGFMIGRGAMGHPLLFRRIRGETLRLDQASFGLLLLEYVRRMTGGGALERAALGRLKQWLRMGAPAAPWIDEAFHRIKRTAALEEALPLLAVAARCA